VLHPVGGLAANPDVLLERANDELGRIGKFECAQRGIPIFAIGD